MKIDTLSPLQNAQGVPYGGLGKEGFYFVTPWSRADGSFNLLYADYTSRQEVYLCAQPNCKHDTESCTSYIPLSPGGVTPEVVGDKLALVYFGSEFGGEDDSNPAHIEAMDLDGANRRTCVSFAANQVLERPMLTDGERIYCRLTTYEEEEVTAELIAIDLEQDGYETVYPMDAQRNERIWGAVKNEIIVYRLGTGSAEDQLAGNELSYELCAWNMDTGEMSVLHQWSETDPFPFYADGQIAYENKEDGVYHILNVSTGEDTPLEGYPIPDKGDSGDVTIIDFADGNLLVREREYGSGAAAKYFVINGQDGQAHPWKLTYSYAGEEMPVTIVGKADAERYLVIAGEADGQVTGTIGDGTSYYAPASTKNYGVMEKEDYWQGTNTISMIQGVAVG